MARLITDDLLALTRRTVRAVLDRAARMPSSAHPWPLAVDATAGNGHDTELLARHIGPHGLVLAFDIQNLALENTRLRLEEAGLSPRVRLLRDGHEHMAKHLPPGAPVAAAMFNLGFLPGGDALITTRGPGTLAALSVLASALMPGGLITAHCYTGQQNGPQEEEAVRAWMSALAWEHWRVARYDFCNKPRNCEVLYMAEKTRRKG